ncbi:hypothetical protein CK489_27400 [Bradyrhizobium sp. UFLA03-84]|nr:hypothetical protein CK489_27400 [Bradyrhizobium sp. UFLA03-84]
MSGPRVPPLDPRVVPPEIDRWNWGAFLLSWIWGVGNNTFIAFLTFVPFVGVVMSFMLGFKGSQWAWRNKRWDSVEHFKRVQRSWARWGAVLWIGSIVLVGSALGWSLYSLGHSKPYELGAFELRLSARAVDILGQPISTGFPVGSISIPSAEGRAILSFSATGPKANGRVFLEALQKSGVWSLSRLTLKVNGRDGVLDLLVVPMSGKNALDRARPGAGVKCGGSFFPGGLGAVPGINCDK